MIWATNKNFEYIENKDESDEDADSDELSDYEEKNIFMYDDLIK